MTYDDIVDSALERVQEFGPAGGMQRSTLLRRIGTKQSQLFQRAGEWNPDFYGTCIVGALSAGAIDLEDIASPLAPIGVIDRLEIAAPGSSSYAALDTVNVVPINDVGSGLAPRVTMRDFILKQVGTDLANVTSLRIYYSKLSKPVTPTDGTSASELRDPYSMLLVLDVALFVLKFQAARNVDVSALQKLLQDEEDVLYTDFKAHVLGAVLDPADRFRRFGS